MKTIIISMLLAFCLYQVSFSQLSVNSETCKLDTFRIGLTKTPLNYTNVVGNNTTVLGVNVSTINYQHATDPTGTKHIAIDWSTLTGTNPNLSDLAIREFIINKILRSFGVGTYNVYYKEECVKEKTCSYQIDMTMFSPSCCENAEDLSFIIPKLYSGSFSPNITFYDVVKKEICGHKCCYDTYSISNSPTPLSITRGQGQGFGISATPCQENFDFHCFKVNPNGTRLKIPCEVDEGCYQWR